MVVGYDTYHDKKQSRAVGAFVASTNHTFSKYHSSVKNHAHNEEISPSFKDHMLKCLKSIFIEYFFFFHDPNLKKFNLIIGRFTTRINFCRRRLSFTGTVSVPVTSHASVKRRLTC